MKLEYHGHSCIIIETTDGSRLLIDPFVTGNPLNDLDVEKIKVDYILVTHGHNDHLGDTVAIAKSNDAIVVACPEITGYVERQGVKRTHGMNIGGSFNFPFGLVKMVYAQHSSAFDVEDGSIYMGNPSGFVITSGEKTVYHAGDTAYFSDMSLIKEDFKVDVAFLPIGDNFTMGIKDAVKATKAIGAKINVPIHYNTFPVIKQNPLDFVNLLQEQSGKVMAVGESLDIS